MNSSMRAFKPILDEQAVFYCLNFITNRYDKDQEGSAVNNIVLFKTYDMNVKNYPEITEVIGHKNYLPSISVIFPFNIKVGMGVELKHKLKTKGDEIEKELAKSYPADVVASMMARYGSLTDNLKPENLYQGLAIFLSPWFQKIYFLDFEPQEKNIIDSSFEIRDLIYNKNVMSKAILVLLSANEIRFYLVSHGQVAKLNVDISDRIEAFMANTLHDVEIHHEKSERRDKAMQLFLQNADEGLGLVLKDHPYPVIFAGSEKFIGHFKKMTKHDDVIEDYIEGNYLESTPAELNLLVGESFGRIREDRSHKIIDQVEDALNKKLLVMGLKEVWKQATEKNGRILIVEKNYRKPAAQGAEDEEILTTGLDHVPFPMQDAVDDVIEKVILNGGLVHFVDDGLLGKYRRIALITYHP